MNQEVGVRLRHRVQWAKHQASPKAESAVANELVSIGTKALSSFRRCPSFPKLSLIATIGALGMTLLQPHWQHELFPHFNTLASRPFLEEFLQTASATMQSSSMAFRITVVVSGCTQRMMQNPTDTSSVRLSTENSLHSMLSKSGPIRRAVPSLWPSEWDQRTVKRVAACRWPEPSLGRYTSISRARCRSAVSRS